MSDFRNIITHPDVTEYIGEVSDVTDAERAKFTELEDEKYNHWIGVKIEQHYDALCDVIDDILRDAAQAVIAEQRGDAHE